MENFWKHDVKGFQTFSATPLSTVSRRSQATVLLIARFIVNTSNMDQIAALILSTA